MALHGLDPVTQALVEARENESPGADLAARVAALEVAPDVDSGGSTPGALVVRKFPFAYNTPGLLAGHAIYTPTVGDILLDAWIQIVTAWDGTTPKADIGPFDTETAGWFNGMAAAYDLSPADADATFNDSTTFLLQAAGTGWRGSLALTAIAGLVQFGVAASRSFPATFADNDGGGPKPLKVCVSTTGATDGADPGSTHGAAILYLVTATPA